MSCALQNSTGLATGGLSMAQGNAQAGDSEPIQIVRHLQDVGSHQPGNSGDYHVAWSFSLAHPAQFPLVVAQRYESQAEIQDDTDDVVSQADYTEVVGLIPAGETRPVIAGTGVAISALLNYARANPATPMVLPTRDELRDFAYRQLEASSPASRPGLVPYYTAALRAYGSEESGICDHWYFTGAQISTSGSTTITACVILYQATPELLAELGTWDQEGGQEHLINRTSEITSDDFDKLFQTAPPSPGMGTGGSGIFLSRNDEPGKPKPLSQFRKLSHEIVPERLTILWKQTDRPILRFAS